jgi:predicted secreted protein
MRVIVLALAIAAAACTPQDNQVAPADAGQIEAPTPDDVSVRITADQAGQTVEVAVNERFAVEVIGVPTAGYQWMPAQVPAFLTRAGEATGNTTPEQGQPGFTGGNHWEVVMFAATAPGTGELVLEQRRPWETDEPPVDSFSVTITAQ